MDIYLAAKGRGKYPTLATDTEVNSCFGAIAEYPAHFEQHKFLAAAVPQ